MFEAIRHARPPRLYVAADGPRASRPDEAARCEEVRRIASAVDWPCELHTLYRERNLGCKQGVSQGISWFFEHESEGIILEDDVLPVDSFFPYCEALLARYRDEPRVMAVSGCNLVGHRHASPTSYFFSRQNHVWGWASWRRAWRHYDARMRSWPQWSSNGGLMREFDGNACLADYWRALFERMHRGEIDTWDYQWTFACWSNGGLTVLPAHNLTHNLGFDADATHTAKEPRHVRLNPAREIALPLSHPPRVERDVVADTLIQRDVIGLSHWRCLRRSLRAGLRRALGQ